MILIDEDARRVANLRVLQRMDATIVDIEGSATHCVLYEFNEISQSWEKKDVEGSLFVAKRSAGFKLVIMNRNSRKNLDVSITSTFQMQVRDPYLIFRDTAPATANANKKRIRGIWFHDGNERQNISTLLQRIVKSLSSQTTTTEQTLPNNNNSSQYNKKSMDTPTAAAALLSPLTLDQPTTSPTPTANPGSVLLDKKSLQLSLMSLLQDERFLDLIHAQYLKVTHARANKEQQTKSQPPLTKK